MLHKPDPDTPVSALDRSGGLMVKESASRAADLGSIPALAVDLFHTSDFKTVATLRRDIIG